MREAFYVPNISNYTNLFGKLVSEGNIVSAACISQCTGCKCSCSCSCRATNEFDVEIDW